MSSAIGGNQSFAPQQTQITLSSSFSDIQLLSNYDALELQGHVFIDAASDYRASFKLSIVKNGAGVYEIAASDIAGDDYTGLPIMSFQISGNYLQCKMDVASPNSGYVKFNIDTPSPALVGSSSLSIEASNIVSGTINSARLPEASASQEGIVTTGTQSFAGDKTFDGIVKIPTTLQLNDATTSPNNSTLSLRFNASGSESGINSVAAGNVVSTHMRFYNNGSNYVGAIATSNSNTFYNDLSDERIKKDLGDWEGLPIVNGTPARKYIKTSEDAKEEYGFFAQELYKSLPQAVQVGGEDVSTAPWMVDYSKVTGVLWKAVQELSAKNAELEERLAKLEQN